MTIYNVTFDLIMGRVTPSKDYDEFFAELKKTEHIRVWKYSWFISTAETRKELLDRLMASLHENDSIVVQDAIYYAANIPRPCWDWLNREQAKIREQTNQS